MANSLVIKLAYEDTDATRQMIFESLTAEAINPAPLKARILAVNDSLAASTSGGMNEFFVSDDGDYLVSIASAHTVSEIETPIVIPSS